MDNAFTNELFSELSHEERIFKFRSADVVGNFLTVNLLIGSEDYKNKLTDHLKEKINVIAASLLPSDVSFKIVYTQTDTTKQNVVNKIIEYIFKEHKSVYSIFASADYGFENDGNVFTVNICLEKYVYEYAIGINLAKKLSEFLDTEFMEEGEIVFTHKENSEFGEVPEVKISAGSIRVITATPTKIYAKGAMSYPRYILDIVGKDKEENNVTLCGVVSDIKMRKIIKPDAKIKEKEFFTFLLNDTTERIKCKFFAKPNEKFNWEDVICDNARLIMNGVYKYDSFDNRFCFYANSLAEAEIDFNSINLKSNFNFNLGRYVYVAPEPYNEVAQKNLFEIETVNEDLLNNVYVVFDLETTGLSTDSDEIIEIAAIKIVNGEFKEKFNTFVKPSDPIPKGITDITGIDDSMVEKAPKPCEVIPDFYHFTKGCILVGHNISNFDIPLLNTQAAKVKYEFDNKFEDTLSMARKKMNLTRNRLGDVCAALGVPLIGAHRAINDVAANAKVFLKLKNM